MLSNASHSIELIHFIIVFKVGTIQDTNTYIAIDDIQLDRTCNSPSNPQPSTLPPTGPTMIVPTGGPTQNPSGNSWFRCNTGLVIPGAKVCDWVKDCPNGEDEKYCGNCQFTGHDICGYKMVNYRMYHTIACNDGPM